MYVELLYLSICRGHSKYGRGEFHADIVLSTVREATSRTPAHHLGIQSSISKSNLYLRCANASYFTRSENIRYDHV
jgi:hypothetical protein